MTTEMAKALLEDLNRTYEMRYRPVGIEAHSFLNSFEKQKLKPRPWLHHIDWGRSGKLSMETVRQHVITLDTGEIIGRGLNGLGPHEAHDSLWKLWEIEWCRDGQLRCKTCNNRWPPKEPGIPEQCLNCSGVGMSNVSSIERI